MREYLEFYIDGKWADPAQRKSLDVINPATEVPFATIGLGSEADVDNAVAAARAAFDSYSRTSREERIALLNEIIDVYKSRYDEIAETISTEMGAPIRLSKARHASAFVSHFEEVIKVLKDYEFEKVRATTLIAKEPIGVCGLITPWNWPVNQIACKLAPALAAGCTVVLKPSEIAPINAIILAQIIHEAGVPSGVFNLVNGDGSTVGQAIASHPGVDMVSITGSTRAGILVAKAAADTVKRICQELGGKSANIILEDADLPEAVARGVIHVMTNSGQSCNAPTRMLVTQNQHEKAVEIAKAVAENKAKVGDPFAEDTDVGPVVSEAQYNNIQGFIEKGIEEGAHLVAGGLGRPDRLDKGYYVRPTVFANVTPDMTIAREEIFGPVLSIIPYKDEEDAIRIANDSVYGLSGYIQSGATNRARQLASRLRAGNVHLNGANLDRSAPFGGYKQSGNGREWGVYGFDEFLEVKSVMGVSPF